MKMIEITTAKVYIAKTKGLNGRRYLTKKAAINAEAQAMIYKIFPYEFWDGDRDEWGQLASPQEINDIKEDSPEWFWRRHAQLCRALKNKIKGK